MFSLWILSAFWLLALLNPVFKKYDYGAGWPMVLMLGVLSAVMIFGLRREKSYAGAVIVWEKVFAAGFLIFYLISFVFSETKNIGYNEFLAFASCFSVYFLFAHRKSEWVEKFMKVVAIGALIACGVGFVLYLFKEAPARMIGPFFNTFYASNLWPNAFALFSLMAWPVFLFFTRGKKSWGWLLGLSFILASLFLTYSRGAYLSAIFQGIILFFFFVKRLDFTVIKKVVFVCVVSYVLVLSANFARDLQFKVVDLSDRITFQGNESSTSVKERYDFWKGAWDLSLEKPFTGWGPFSFRYVYQAREQKDLLAIADHPHNVFLKIAMENGIIALSFFLMFLSAVLFKFVFGFNKLKSKESQYQSMIVFTAIGGAFAHNMIDYNFNFISNLLLVFVLLAALSSLFAQNFYTVPKNSGSGKGLFVFFLITFVSVSSAYEGGVLVYSQLINKDARAYSMYTREYYTNKVEEYLDRGDFENALLYANKQLALNHYDDQMWIVKGNIYLDKNSGVYDPAVAGKSFINALNANNFASWSGVLKSYELTGDADLTVFKYNLENSLKAYKPLAEQNIHFTSYTPNADVAAALYVELFGSDELLRIIEEQRASRK